MIPDEVITILISVYEAYLKKYVSVLIIIFVLLLIAGMSIIFLGNDNTVEKDVERMVEAELIIIK